MDLIAALLAIGWGTAEPGGDGIGSWSVGVLVGGLERTQGIDVLIIGRPISPAYVPPIEWEDRACMTNCCAINHVHSLKTSCRLCGTSSEVNNDGRVSTVTRIWNNDGVPFGTVSQGYDFWATSLVVWKKKSIIFGKEGIELYVYALCMLSIPGGAVW